MNVDACEYGQSIRTDHVFYTIVLISKQVLYRAEGLIPAPSSDRRAVIPVCRNLVYLS